MPCELRDPIRGDERLCSCACGPPSLAFRRPKFVLAILAICRRYGHREEPDDHAFLPMHPYGCHRGVAHAVS